MPCMTGYQCWFCGKGIERADASAVKINVESLWRWSDGPVSEDDPWQMIYAHSYCAKDRMAGKTGKLEPDIVGEDH